MAMKMMMQTNNVLICNSCLVKPRPCTLKFEFPITIPAATHSSLSLSHYQIGSFSSLSRRVFLPYVSGIWDALTGGNRDAVLAIRVGMQLFRQGDVAGSLAEFDRAIELDPRQKSYLWQRGLSLYYLDRFEDGADQFRLDVANNPNDTEESIWCFLCEARLYGADQARKLFLEVVKDPRPVMRQVYTMYKHGGNPEKLVEIFSRGREDEYFYASLYAGLYYESLAKQDAARKHIEAAVGCPYGQRSNDYMASLAKVHLLCRKWGPDRQ